MKQNPGAVKRRVRKRTRLLIGKQSRPFHEGMREYRKKAKSGEHGEDSQRSYYKARQQRRVLRRANERRGRG